jgi:hypothetical protein
MSMFERLIHFHAADITEQELCITESMSVRSRRTDSDDEGTNIGSGDREARTDEAKNETGNEEEALGQIRGLLQRLKVKEKQSKVVVTLQTQRRMHPTISQFLRQSLYPRLEDATVVKGYPSVKGVKGRLNFFTHTFPDTSSNKGSISNVGEAQLVVQFVKYMILQGYKGSHEIVVLTPYVGQILVLRRLLQEEMKIFTEISEADNDELVDLMDKLEDKTEAEEASKKIIMLAGNVQVQLKNEKLEQCIRLATVDNFQVNINSITGYRFCCNHFFI